MVAGVYMAICAVGLIYLSARVIGLRRAHRVSVGHQGDIALERAMRLQANFTEYVPLALLMLALAEAQGLPTWAVHTLGLGLVASRVTHFLGFRSDAAPLRLRVGGMTGTFGVLGVLAVVLVVQAGLGVG